jgi:hypothetical protein
MSTSASKLQVFSKCQIYHIIFVFLSHSTYVKTMLPFLFSAYLFLPPFFFFNVTDGGFEYCAHFLHKPCGAVFCFVFLVCFIFQLGVSLCYLGWCGTFCVAQTGLLN